MCGRGQSECREAHAWGIANSPEAEVGGHAPIHEAPRLELAHASSSLHLGLWEKVDLFQRQNHRKGTWESLGVIE